MKSFRKQFLCIFAISLVATLLLCPGNYSVPGGIRENFAPVEVQAEEPTITDTQKGVALLMTILFAQGLRFVGDWDTVVQPGLEKLWDDFTTATGNAVTLPMIVAGSSLALGYIRTSNTVNNAIANFTAWYKQTFSQPTTGETTVPVSSTPGSYIPVSLCTVVATGYGSYQGRNYYVSATNNASEVRYVGLYTGNETSSVNIYMVSQNPFDFKINNGTTACDYSSLSAAHTVLYNGITYYVSSSLSFRRDRYNSVAPAYRVSTSTEGKAISYTFGADVVIGDVSMTGESLELKDGYQLEQDQAKLYDISALTALVAELALTLDNIEDLVRDIPVIFDTPWAEDFPDVPAYVDTPDDTIPWVTVPDSVIPADTPEYVPTTPGETDSYKILGLERVFPFSIPFDLYYLTQIFVATPETPHFTYAIMNPATNQLLTQEFDLHWFDTLAAVIRTGETVAFLIFLIFVTRGLIRS